MRRFNSLFLGIDSLILIATTASAVAQPRGSILAAIQTNRGTYLTAVNGGGLGGPNAGPDAVPVHTDSTSVRQWETFAIVWLDTNHTQFALRTWNGHYVTAAQGGGVGGPNNGWAPVHADATTVRRDERWRLDFLGGDRVAISLPNGRFLSAVNGGGMNGPPNTPVQTNRLQIGAWETFRLIRLR